MRPIIFTLLLVAYCLWPACQHPEVADLVVHEPMDTTQTLTCEDTIEINFPGTMEHGFFEAVKTCRDWKASGSAHLPGAPHKHLNISAFTYFPYILTNGDTVFFYAEGLALIVPKKTGKFPMISVPGVHPDTATCSFSYLESDIFLATWLVDGTFTDNEIEITELDLIHKKVKGRFTMHLTIDTTMVGYKYYPSTLHFKEGEFELDIME